MSIGKFINKFWWLILLLLGGLALWYFKFRKKGGNSNSTGKNTGAGKEDVASEEDLTKEPPTR